MSSSEYYLFGKDGEVIDHLELSNGHGCMPAIWGHYSEALGLHDWENKVSRLAYMFKFSELVQKTTREGSDVDKLLMGLSWEPIFMPAELFEPFKEGLAKVIRSCPSNHVNHWPEVIKWLEKERDQEVIGYGHYTTSVNENSWLTQPEDPDDPDVDPWEDFEQEHKKPHEVLHLELGGEGLGIIQPPNAGTPGAAWLPPDLR